MACTEKDEAAYCPKFICVKKAGFLHKRQLSYKNRDFKIQRRGRQRKRQKKKTIDSVSRTSTLHVHHAFLYISFPVFARLRRENA